MMASNSKKYKHKTLLHDCSSGSEDFISPMKRSRVEGTNITESENNVKRNKCKYEVINKCLRNISSKVNLLAVKELNNVNMDYINNKKTNTRSDLQENIPELLKQINQKLNDLLSNEKSHIKKNQIAVIKDSQAEVMKESQGACSSRSNVHEYETRFLKEQTELQTVQNFKPCIMKVIEELKNKLSKFKQQVNHLQLKYLKDKVMSHYDAENLVFIIGCIINKLKEELSEHQNDIVNCYFQNNVKYNCEEVYVNTSGEHNVNNFNPSESLSEKLIPNETNRLTNNVSSGKNDISTAMAQNNNNIKYDNNMENNEELLLILSKLTEINLIKKVTDNSAAISTNVKDNRLSVEVAKKEVQKHERPVKHPIIFEIPVSTKQHTTVEHSDKVQQKTSNKNLAENKSRSKKNQVIVLNYDSDVNSTCSTVALYPIMRKDNKRSHKYKGSNVKGTVHQNTDCTILKSPILKDTGLKEKVNSKTQPDTVYQCNSNETVIITNNKQCNPNEQDLHNDSTIIYQVDQDALSECSCASTVYSPDHVSVDTTNLRSEYLSKFNQISKQNACNMDQKLLMSCKVLVENIDKNTKIS